MGRDSVVGIATRYELDGPGIESRWGTRYPALVQIGRGADTASCTTGTGSFPGLKRPGRGVDHAPPSCVEVKEREELYLYSPSGPSWSVLRWTLTLIVLILSYRIFTYWRLTEVASEWLFVCMCGFYSDIRHFEFLPCPALASEGCKLILLLYAVAVFVCQIQYKLIPVYDHLHWNY
jgi:hypothetical protein